MTDDSFLNLRRKRDYYYIYYNIYNNNIIIKTKIFFQKTVICHLSSEIDNPYQYKARQIPANLTPPGHQFSNSMNSSWKSPQIEGRNLEVWRFLRNFASSKRGQKRSGSDKPAKRESEELKVRVWWLKTQKQSCLSFFTRSE